MDILNPFIGFLKKNVYIKCDFYLKNAFFSIHMCKWIDKELAISKK